jgi:hypothetical protein
MVIVWQTTLGAYILAEIDGAVVVTNLLGSAR